MNNEVKEILEALNSTACCPYHDDMCKKAKNYIINLQEENEDYKLRCEKIVDEIQQLIDDVNNKTIIGLNNFLPKLEEIQDELADGVAETSI